MLCSSHQTAVQKHCDHLMEFQGKMVEASLKFESLEEEHLAQMVTFMIKISQVIGGGWGGGERGVSRRGGACVCGGIECV